MQDNPRDAQKPRDANLSVYMYISPFVPKYISAFYPAAKPHQLRLSSLPTSAIQNGTTNTEVWVNTN